MIIHHLDDSKLFSIAQYCTTIAIKIFFRDFRLFEKQSQFFLMFAVGYPLNV
jgi:hypothetical protein